MTILREKISAPHQRVHDGQAFRVGHNSASLASGSTINVYMETPASPNPHLVFEAHGSGAFDFEVLEAPTVTSATGTAKAVKNKRRTGTPPTSGVQDNQASPVADSVSTDVTVTADGTIIYDDTISGGNKIGGEIDFAREFILKASTKYVFRLTSQENGNRCHINLDWYEQG